MLVPLLVTQLSRACDDRSHWSFAASHTNPPNRHTRAPGSPGFTASSKVSPASVLCAMWQTSWPTQQRRNTILECFTLPVTRIPNRRRRANSFFFFNSHTLCYTKYTGFLPSLQEKLKSSPAAPQAPGVPHMEGVKSSDFLMKMCVVNGGKYAFSLSGLVPNSLLSDSRGWAFDPPPVLVDSIKGQPPVRLHTRRGTVRRLFRISRCTVWTDCSNNAEQDRTQDNEWAA